MLKDKKDKKQEDTKVKKTKEQPTTHNPKPEPTVLVNERQETIFDTDITIAVDNYVKSEMEVRLWKERNKANKKDLIKIMRDKKQTEMVMNEQKVLKYSYTAAKEDVKLEDYKPSNGRGRSRPF